MTTTAVIKHFDVFKQVRDGFAVRAIPGGLKNQVQRLANPVAANSIAMASSGVFQLRV